MFSSRLAEKKYKKQICKGFILVCLKYVPIWLLLFFADVKKQ